MSPGTAYLLAYLPARRLAHLAQFELLARNVATIDPALKHAIDFSREALNIEEFMVAEADTRLADIAAKARIALAPMPSANELSEWLAALGEHVRPYLTTPVLQAAWKAGEAARLVWISVTLVAHTAYLRCAVPADADLTAQAAGHARELKQSAAKLTSDLQATGLPLVINKSTQVEELVSLEPDLTPTTSEGYRQLNELVRAVDDLLETKVRHLDANN